MISKGISEKVKENEGWELSEENKLASCHNSISQVIKLYSRP